MMETFLSSRHYLGRCCFLLKSWTERVRHSLSKSVSADVSTGDNSKAERSETFNERIGRVGVGETSAMSFGKLMR